MSLSLRKTGLFVPKPSPRRISRRWSYCNSKEQPSCYGCSSNIKPQRSDRSLILEHLVGGHKQGGEIGAEYLAAESVRASASYNHSTIDQCRGWRLKFRMLLVLCFLESGDVRELLGGMRRVASQGVRAEGSPMHVVKPGRLKDDGDVRGLQVCGVMEV